MPNRFPYGDKKFYYNIHCNRQRADGNEPLSYCGFILRLWRGMNVHDAIYAPAGKKTKSGEYKSTPEDDARRRQKLNEENVMILDFDEIDELERKQNPVEPLSEVMDKLKDGDSLNVNKIVYNGKTIHLKQNIIQTPKPKPSLLDRFISLFK